MPLTPTIQSMLYKVMDEQTRLNGDAREWRLAQAEIEAHPYRWTNHSIYSMINTLAYTRDQLRSPHIADEREEKEDPSWGLDESDIDPYEFESICRENAQMRLDPSWLDDEWLREADHLQHEENRTLFNNCQVLISCLREQIEPLNISDV